MSETPPWEQFQPFIRDVVVASLHEKRGKLVSDFAMGNAQISSMMAGMAAGVVEEVPSDVPEFLSGMLNGQEAGTRGAQMAILAAFDAAIAKLEPEG